MGAGAPLDLTLPTGLIWPSTRNITTEVRKPYDMILTPGRTTDLVERIYQHFMKVFPVNQNGMTEYFAPSIDVAYLVPLLRRLEI